jgi:hypothetical protein
MWFLQHIYIYIYIYSCKNRGEKIIFRPTSVFQCHNKEGLFRKQRLSFWKVENSIRTPQEKCGREREREKEKRNHGLRPPSYERGRGRGEGRAECESSLKEEWRMDVWEER